MKALAERINLEKINSSLTRHLFSLWLYTNEIFGMSSMSQLGDNKFDGSL